MKTIKKSIVLLFSASLLFLGGCAKNHNDIILHKTQSFWTGSPVITVNVPYPEPLSFELPSADWVPLKVRKKEKEGARVELAEGEENSYVKLAIEGQTKSLFESLETDSGVDFSQSDSLVLTGLFDHYKTMTQAENSDKPIQYGETKFERQDGDVFAWMVTTNNSYGVAYAVLKTKNGNYFTVEVNQKNRTTDIEKTLVDIVKSHKTY
jgi:hypothetical protein